mmetsp:Transcript_10789/g.16067  ORF Transcript_10789/g.16067 Transcript_10789/m.16067 type:complete len:347 (-) Transcript_10789:72-1112(-)
MDEMTIGGKAAIRVLILIQICIILGFVVKIAGNGGRETLRRANLVRRSGGLWGARRVRTRAMKDANVVPMTPTLSNEFDMSVYDDPERVKLKGQLLQLACAMDRGQLYNPQRSGAYEDRANVARGLIEKLIENAPPLPKSLKEMDGEWELVYSTVRYGIFRSSPFFLAIQEAFGNETAFGQKSSELFFKLHELQTCSFGLSTIGRVAQLIDSEKGILASEFDTTIFGLTVLPIIGWFSLLPTFGGCVITVADAKFGPEAKINMEVDYTVVKPIDGLGGWIPGRIFFNKRIPVNAIWRLLPWNWGKKPTCSVQVKYLDSNFRIVADGDGELFVYARPVMPRPTLQNL